MRISDWSSDVCSSDLIGCKVETQRGLLIASIADRLFVTANRASNAGRAMLCTEIDKRLTQKLAGVIFRKRHDWRAELATACPAQAFFLTGGWTLGMGLRAGGHGPGVWLGGSEERRGAGEKGVEL